MLVFPRKLLILGISYIAFSYIRSYHLIVFSMNLSTTFIISFTDKLDEIFEKAGFEAIERSYVERRTVNKKENIDVPRIFVQGRYKKVVNNTNT